jgi:hypothetical protein
MSEMVAENWSDFFPLVKQAREELGNPSIVGIAANLGGSIDCSHRFFGRQLRATRSSPCFMISNGSRLAYFRPERVSGRRCLTCSTTVFLRDLLTGRMC